MYCFVSADKHWFSSCKRNRWFHTCSWRWRRQSHINIWRWVEELANYSFFAFFGDRSYFILREMQMAFIATSCLHQNYNQIRSDSLDRMMTWPWTQATSFSDNSCVPSWYTALTEVTLSSGQAHYQKWNGFLRLEWLV